MTGVYPRACGGTSRRFPAWYLGQGLSPRVRGNPDHRACADDAERSIPARAGEPRGRRRRACEHRVYPRACGGTSCAASGVTFVEGLSPRVRGNQDLQVTFAVHEGSIPARAGEPSASRLLKQGLGVYPRACGGTIFQIAFARSVSGLSPRVRGNLTEHWSSPLMGRVYPARAGEPVRPLSANPFIQGLSPRVRGNRCIGSGAGTMIRSIPARAGEPLSPGLSSSPLKVYPRACGGTRLTWSFCIPS